MFVGLTRLFIGAKLIGDISTIRKDEDGKTWIFEMHDKKGIYKSDKLKDIDVYLGCGDKIVIPA